MTSPTELQLLRKIGYLGYTIWIVTCYLGKWSPRANEAQGPHNSEATCPKSFETPSLQAGGPL